MKASEANERLNEIQIKRRLALERAATFYDSASTGIDPNHVDVYTAKAAAAVAAADCYLKLWTIYTEEDNIDPEFARAEALERELADAKDSIKHLTDENARLQKRGAL